MGTAPPAPSAGHWESVRTALHGANLANRAAIFEFGIGNPKSAQRRRPTPKEGAGGTKARA